MDIPQIYSSYKPVDCLMIIKYEFKPCNYDDDSIE